MSVDLDKEKIRVVVREVLREESHIPVDLFERLVRVEEGLKNLADIVEKRFDDVNNRFIMLTIFLSVGFAALGTLMTVFQFIH
ncbi:MAG: hypothetical protein AB1742_02520 [bacterium]